MLEAPKPRLKAIQRRILREILAHVPPHEAAHGFRKARSIASFASPHCGQAIVLRYDLLDFFASVPASRVHAVFATAGYPPEVARLLTGLCTNVVPGDAWPAVSANADPSAAWRERARFRSPHLPQGAPTSPALANLCARRLDVRLAALAAALGAVYTRYADDLALSGGGTLDRAARRLQVHVCRMALEEGFAINTRKTRFMRASVRQRIVGIVVNRHPNPPREEYDNLKAILHNCVVHGPTSQNRLRREDFRAHLQGRVAHVAMLNPHRGQRLLALLERIDWSR
jgi:hypothetical protein